jgi:predicted ArsR family transcriptional regulator
MAMDHVNRRRNAPQRVREALASSPAGRSVRELTSVTHFHENAVRRTLSLLVARGEVLAEPQRAGTRGRPALRYRLVGGTAEAFKTVLPMLVELLDPSPAAAYACGFAHGRASTAPGDTREAVVSSLVTLGFAPLERARGRPAVELELTGCPFRDAVVDSPGGRQICHLHHGLVAGIAAATGGELRTFAINDPRLEPCRVVVDERAAAAET